jgi:hypothetical protein
MHGCLWETKKRAAATTVDVATMRRIWIVFTSSCSLSKNVLHETIELFCATAPLNKIQKQSMPTKAICTLNVKRRVLNTITNAQRRIDLLA